MPKRIDLTGKTFNRLKVIRFAGLKGGFTYWECQCDCGNLATVQGRRMRDGKTQSCGCLHKERISYTNSEEYPINILLRTYIRGAKQRGLEWGLSRNQFVYLVKKHCFYCGVPPAAVITRPRAKGTLIYNGIDRVDNSRGYELDNCVTCCGFCNRSKFKSRPDEFLDKVIRVYLYQFTVQSKTQIRNTRPRPEEPLHLQEIITKLVNGGVYDQWV